MKKDRIIFHMSFDIFHWPLGRKKSVSDCDNDK